MQITGMYEDVLTLLLQIAKDSFPSEFLAELSHTNGIIDDILIIPGTITNQVSAFIRNDTRPLILNLAGTAHSHPNGVLAPSATDTMNFAKLGGTCHIIIGPPFTRDSWKAFHSDGTARTLAIVQHK